MFKRDGNRADFVTLGGDQTKCEAQIYCGAGERFNGTSGDAGACNACPEGQFQSDATNHRTTECAEWTVCEQGAEFELTSPSSIKNRVCASLSGDCSATQYVVGPPSLEAGFARGMMEEPACSLSQHASTSIIPLVWCYKL